jgi:UTP-glucose-1-phosphate uridylyltransferase
MDSFGPNNEILLEYSLYDAIRAGFTKVIFVIRRDFEEAFKKLIADKFSGKIQVEYAFQELTDLPNGFQLPATREKPRGTGHAVLCATPFIQEPFAVINADDFYGRASYQLLADFLKNPHNGEKCCLI